MDILRGGGHFLSRLFAVQNSGRLANLINAIIRMSPSLSGLFRVSLNRDRARAHPWSPTPTQSMVQQSAHYYRFAW
jgi:hypothetical protein